MNQTKTKKLKKKLIQKRIEKTKISIYQTKKRKLEKWMKQRGENYEINMSNIDE